MQRDSLKWLLVCCFGYTGYKNARFGKIEAHEAINAVARETLLVAKEIAENDGFALLHALVDSLYVWKEGATREDFERLAREIEVKTRLPLAIEAVYRYVVFLPSRQYADVPVPNRFFAVAEDGELKVRGLECRRHDTPPLLKRMQHEVLAILAEAHDCESYLQKLELARMVLAGYEERLAAGDVEIKDLVVGKQITREPRDYQKAGLTSNYDRVRTSNTSSLIANRQCQMTEYAHSRSGRDGSGTTARNTPRCCAKRSSLSNRSPHDLYRETIRVRFRLRNTGPTLHFSLPSICPIRPISFTAARSLSEECR